MSTPDEIRNVVVLGHKGTGKTALVEAALFIAKAKLRAKRARVALRAIFPAIGRRSLVRSQI